ncbi:DUF5908 family protein [Desulfobulbus sp.]|uniref:DUF5908 family protein n=1 Tax=Desulfobulbus sp. TaxID=895 RepID=UPI00286ED726|nr:DUF5908 family protein [Desulfobulbus sp.]
MPVIIDEVIISVEVDNRVSGGTAAPSTLDIGDRQALVAECVEQVLEILEQKAER